MATELVFHARRRRTPAVKVYVKERWADAWDIEPDLYCDSVVFTANPDMATAHFTWRYGRLIPPGKTTWVTVAPYDGLRNFVKVVIEDPDHDRAADDPSEPPPIVWHGILEQDSGQQKGILAAPAGQRHKAGTQRLVAYGLDLMLARHVLRSSAVDYGNGIEGVVGRAAPFNAAANAGAPDQGETGNRSADLGDKLTYLFASELAEARLWSSYDIARYLLAYQPPPNQVDDVVIPWDLDSATFLGGTLPSFDTPRVAQQARSLRQVLDELLDRRRLLGYTVDVAPPTDLTPTESVVLRCFTFAPSAIEYEGHAIGANQDQVSLVFDGEAALESAVVRRASLEQVDQVVCQGERAVACFTIVAGGDVLTPTGTLVPGWTLAQQNDYNAGASGVAGYGDLDLYQQQQLNDAARSVDRLRRVYSYWGLDSVWQGKVGAPGAEVSYFPRAADDPTPLPYYLPLLKFRSHLPLKTNHDYSGARIDTGTVLDHNPPGQKWEYLPPLVGIRIPHSVPDRWQLVDRLSSSVESLAAPSLGLEDGYKWSAGVRMQDDWPGIVVSVSGQPQHVLAKHDFTPLPEDEHIHTFDWQDGLWATVAMDVDRHVEGAWPQPPLENEAVRRLVVDLGERYQQHYVAEYTVVGLDASGEKIVSAGGFVRDDTPRLEALARLIYEWYRTPRASLELVFGYVTGRLHVGQLVTTIGKGDSLQTVNSVVTMVKYEFGEAELGGECAARTHVTTQFAEFDARRFVGAD